MKRLLFLLCLIPVFGVAAYAQSTPPENPKYKQFKGQASAPANPPSGSYRMYVDNTGAVKIVNSSGVATAVGGSYDKLTQSGTNNGTLTLYDDTAVTGDSSLVIRGGPGQSANLLSIRNAANAEVSVFRGTGEADLGGNFAQYQYGGNAKWLAYGPGSVMALASDFPIVFSSTTGALGTADIGLARASAGVLKVTDGSSGYGGLIAAQLDLTHGITGGGSQVITLSTDQSFYTTGAGGWRFLTIYNGEVYVGGVDAAQAGDLHLRTAGTDRWNVLQAGGLQPGADNTYGIGDSTHAVKNLFVASSVQGWQTKTLTESAATGFVDIALAQNTVIGGFVEYVVRTTNGTDYSVESGQLFFTGASKTNGTVDDADVGLVGTPVQSTTAANTFTNQFTVTKGTNKITLNCQSDSTLTSTDTITLFYRVHLNGAQTETITGL